MCHASEATLSYIAYDRRGLLFAYRSVSRLASLVVGRFWAVAWLVTKCTSNVFALAYGQLFVSVRV